MDKKENIIRMNPQFIRLRDGSLMNINNIVAISEDDSKVFVLGYQRIPITEEDMADVLGNIEIIDDDGHQHHCGQDAHRQASDDDAKKLEQLIGARVRLFHAPGHKCDECPYRIKSDGSTCNYFKVETASGYYLCLARPQQDERPVISFDEEEQQQEEATRTIMDDIIERAQDFLDYLDSIW